MNKDYFNRPSKASVEKAIDQAGKRLDETEAEIQFCQTELVKLYDDPKPTKKVREKIQALQETMLAKGNLYSSLMGRMEALAWSIGAVLKHPVTGAELTIGEPMLKKSGPMLFLPDTEIQA